jgi:DNA/RNA-binding domain of Phe-tRNA-synthetase-like protein
MITINIENELKTLLPNLVLKGFVCRVNIRESSSEFGQIIDSTLGHLANVHDPESIRELETVKATKDAYRVLEKDPNRYRPAAEALLRRLANGNGLYRLNNVVDVLNLISAKTGYSICGYDFDNVIGKITLGIGEPEEPYIGIGRGDINIERLPVFRDELSAFGTPTSDSVRTMVSSKTRLFLMIFIAFDDNDALDEAVEQAKDLLVQFADSEDFDCFTVTAKD